MKAASRSNGYVGALLHGLQILDMFDQNRTTIGIGEMAKELGLHKSSASRLALTLASAGYLTTTLVQGTYELGPRLAALGQLAGRKVDIERLVTPHLERLSWLTGETGHLAELEGKIASTLAVTDGWHAVRMHAWRGKKSSALSSSMGKVLLTGLGEARVRGMFVKEDFIRHTEHTTVTVNDLVNDLNEVAAVGYSLDDEELEIGLRCIGAPVFDSSGLLDASISISGPAQRITRERIAVYAAHVRYAAWQASKARGAIATPPGWPAPPVEEPSPLEWVENARSRSNAA